VVDSFYGRFAENLEIAHEKIPKVDLDEQKEVEFVGRECPICGNPLVYRQGRYGRLIGCSTFPKCRHTVQIFNKNGVKCPNYCGELVENRTRRGRGFYGCANYT
jgi:DNA topoisomerase-1